MKKILNRYICGDLIAVESIVRCADRNIIFIRILLMVIFILLEESFHQSKINDALVEFSQKFLCIIHDHADFCIGISSQITLQNPAHEHIADRPCGAEVDLFFLIRLLHLILHRDLVMHHCKRRIAQNLTCPCKLQLLSLIPEKLRIIMLLQKMNVLGHRRLRNIQFFRCACEIHTLTYS